MFSLKWLFWIKKKWFDSDIWDYSLFDEIWNDKDVLNSLSRTDYISLYTGWIYVCVSTIANEVAKLERQIFWSENRQDKLRNHKYANLIKRQFLVDVVSYLQITWSAFVLKETFWSTITWLRVLRSDRIVINQTEEWEIINYRYFNWKKDVIYTPEEVFAIHNFNPYQAYPHKTMWVSPVQAVAIQWLMDKEIINWNYNFFKNWASIWSVMETDKKIEPTNRQFLLQKLKKEFIWSKNAHAIAILDQGLKLREIKPWQREMDFVEQRRFTRDEILWIFKVPKAVIGLWEKVNVWNVEAFEKIFASKTILPICMQLEEVINDNIFKWNWYFKFVNVLPIDEEKIIMRYNSWLITKNEARLALNYQELENWNIFVDWTEASVKENKSKIANILEKAFTKSLKQTEKGSEEYLEKRWEEKIKRTDDYEKEMWRLMWRVFEAQEKQIVWKLEKSIKEIDDIENEDDLWDETLMITLYLWLFTWFFTKMIKKEWSIAIAEVWDLVFNSWNINKWIFNNIKRFGKDIDTTTKKEILTIIKNGKNAWISTENIVKQIKWKFAQYKTSRIKKITRTEVSRAVSYSRLEAWKQAWIKKKKWYTARDERVCPICSEMSWKVVALWKPFYKKWETHPSWYKFNYEDVMWAPAHPDCRCDIVAED